METLQRTANRGSISTGFDISNSLKLEADNNEWLYNASPTAGNRQIYTISFWIKRSGLGSVNAAGQQYVIGQGQHGRMFFTNDYFSYRFDDGHDCRNVTRRFRDPNAWYHFVVAVDTTQATASNRVKLYVNGDTLEVDDHDGGSFPDQTDQGAFFSTNYLTIGTAPFGGSYNAGDGDYDMRGYLSEFVAIDGQQLDPTSFGEFDSDSGIWKPIDVSGLTFGSEGFYLKFDDTSSAGKDSSGNGNNFSDSNLSAADHTTDTPTNNFCTFNTLVQTDNKPTISEGAMKVVGGGGNWNNAYGSLGVQNGKWYYEYKVNNTDIGGHGWSTFPDTSDDATSTQFLYDQSAVLQGANTHYYQRINGTQISNESTGFGTSAVNDIFGVFLNADDQEITFAKNGSVLSGSLSQPISLNSAFSGHFIFPCNVQYENDGGEYNFGGYTLISNTRSYNDANGYGNFVYSPVLSGVNYYSICTKNIAEFG